ncbi:hypothetical protein FE257_008249 [Aspergillus nanangensis]|uniref:FAD-binding FR-type domain-containing protein n=1 Tax=Aspergillus nanangensis TaxID=2582783 RepID=A0AAD4CLS7_ASPNN|nr:hypothetical protein FE257_008249 [Aspergillus nanangensis]
MDHEEPLSGLPWLSQPVQLHSSRADTCKLTPEQCVYRRGHWRYWYEADHVYALNTIYFLCATVGIFTLIHWGKKFAPLRLKQTVLWKRSTTIARYLAYRCFQLPVLPNSPSLGVMLLGIMGAAFFVVMTLAPKPYYWPNTDTLSFGSSPPIATRSGWMALALLPFVLALSAKANLISALTGVSHEKLQIFHHWTSYAMFVLALVHTFPFIIYHIDQGDMVSKWKSDLTYWTGVAALVPQTYLTVMSLPSIRNRFYEFFKATHFLAALLFLLFFFFHCDFRLSSWDYFIATATIYLLSLTISQIKTSLVNGRQHVFIRFLSPQLGLHCLTAHPFTICSIPKGAQPSEMVFYVQVRGGVTARLAKIAARDPGRTVRVLVEGGYGGIQSLLPSDSNHLPEETDTVVVSGGAGAGFSLGVLDGILTQQRKGKVQVVYATRSRAVGEWYAGEIAHRVKAYDAAQVEVLIHITEASVGARSDSGSCSPSGDSKVDGRVCASPEDSLLPGRPDLPGLIARMQMQMMQTPRLAIYVCGPASMVHDVRNAAAAAQRGVLCGAAGEVLLHTEPFSW